MKGNKKKVKKWTHTLLFIYTIKHVCCTPLDLVQSRVAPRMSWVAVKKKTQPILLGKVKVGHGILLWKTQKSNFH